MKSPKGFRCSNVGAHPYPSASPRSQISSSAVSVFTLVGLVEVVVGVDGTSRTQRHHRAYRWRDGWRPAVSADVDEVGMPGVERFAAGVTAGSFGRW